MLWYLIALSVLLPACIPFLSKLLVRLYGLRASGSIFLLTCASFLFPLILGTESQFERLFHTRMIPIRLLLSLLPLIFAALSYQITLFYMMRADTHRTTYMEHLKVSSRGVLLVLLPVAFLSVFLLGFVAIYKGSNYEGLAILPLILVVLSLYFVAYPSIFKVIMRGQSLKNGPLRQKLYSITLEAGISISDIVVIPKVSKKHLNAWVAGLASWSRVVFLTEDLIELFSLEEVTSIFCHELGHIKLNHLYKNLIISVISVVFFSALSYAAQIAWPALYSPTYAVTRGACIGILACFIFTFFSRKYELEADEFACRITRSPQIYVGALRKFALVGISSDARNSLGWLAYLQSHPPIGKRIERVQYMAARELN